MGKEARHNEGVYLTLCLRHTEIFQTISIKVLNLAAVDAPGVIISTRVVSMQATIVPFRVRCVFAYTFHADSVFHIGVGSDVVCSTLIGSGRASVCGIDNR